MRLDGKVALISGGPRGMGANSVRAGPIVTRMTESTRVDPEQYEFNPERVPQGRSGEPMEIADGELVIDDGITAR